MSGSDPQASSSFFERQALARRNTRILVVLFALAVLGIVLAVDIVLAALYAFSQDQPAEVPAGILVAGALGTVALILAVTLFNVIRLGGGGEAVARMAGARKVDPGTRDPLERRFLNVVEEMAIASGVRVPAAYVMDGEPGINAFAAGWDVSHAVVAVTRGALETLTRDELQGVVAHEFSHILHGDMRINVRMIGVLAGIVFIGAIGEFLMRSTRGSRKGGQLFLAGLAIFAIGYIGLFFARLIKAAVSREREYLADASSVQFTRNPEGIAGALDQIRLSSSGALIRSRHAEDLSHMFFGQSVKLRLAGLFATHPPLDERIRRIHRSFDAASYRKARAAAALEAPHAEGRRSADLAVRWGRTPEQSLALVGALDAASRDRASELIEAIPAPIRAAVHDAGGAAAAIVAVLLAPVDEVRAAQLQAVRDAGAGALAAPAEASAAHTRNLGPEHRLPLVDLALPALHDASPAAKDELVRALEAAIHADRRVSLHELVVLELVKSQLAPAPKGPPAEGRTLSELGADAQLLLELMAHAGRRADARDARERLTLAAVSAALRNLKALAPLEKARFVKGLFAAATSDGEIRVAEAELLRLAGAVLDCPLPPAFYALSASASTR
jgi:Zn-dependent protease with chaperone function